MVSAGNYIDSFNYAELSQNYDPIYDTLVNGGVVWIHLNYNNTDVVWPERTGEDGYLRFMVVEWAVVPGMGLVILSPEGVPLIFPNGSHHTSSPK